jgi:predicted amidohydrolase
MQPIIESKGIEEAEAIIRACLRETSNAPYLIVGMPMWKDSEQGSISTAFNNCRVYAPNGDIERNCLKAHSCEIQYSHGHRLNEFEIHGIPICLHVCHDRRYPELTTLPVMFGSRLNIHPVNGGLITGTRESVQALAKEETWTNHAFYLRASAGGGSYIVGPQKFNNLITISSESMLTSVPGGIVGNPEEELIHAQIRIHDAFGYWPIRSYRASESIAEAYDHLYRAMGGKNI